MEIERFEQIKENHKHNKKMLELNSPSQYIEINESELEDIGWLISTVEVLQKLVNYHQKKQKEAEDENEPYRHENARLRETIEQMLELSREQCLEVSYLSRLHEIGTKTLEGKEWNLTDIPKLK
ncbi:hypothetical protein DCC39_14485 [Pueribacillus theae]|uniref:Uncharacterized protein n=1 Tax=Pueribacillus theae TaxID=2171751 RepID=A0A2U1JU11_9BACI|nr:hypothetical protein [Pueribacillus theae]PWA08642.1 hypothetical protein DCC39_14485 [Pueribacillus theae]